MERTFVTLATPPGEGGIHVILLGGKRAIPILREVFRARRRGGETGPGTLLLGHIVDGEEILDEVLVAERSHGDSGEPSFEINVHGGPTPARAVLDLLVGKGAFPLSLPRALGRLRIGGSSPAAWRARVLMSGARSLWMASLLAEQAGGALADAFRDLHADLLKGLEGSSDAISSSLRRCEALLATLPLGSVALGSPTAILLGPPNAGKSTLFNSLVGRERTIVDASPGTTRDRIQETVELFGIPILLSDSAGLTDKPHTPVEEAGVVVGREGAGRAHLRIFLFDGARPPGEDDFAEWERVGEPRLLVVGKADLPVAESVSRAVEVRTKAVPIRVSGREGVGLDALGEAVLGALGIPRPIPGVPVGPVLLGGRGVHVLREAAEALKRGERATILRAARFIQRYGGDRSSTSCRFPQHG
jgi:tRNA modification GTPase